MRYDTICYFNVGSKTEYVNLIYRTEPTAKKYKKRKKIKSKKRICSEVYYTGSGESVESVPKKKMDAAVARICRKRRF